METINYKLVQLIKSLSEKEIKQFRKFISSPYYSKGRNYLPFLDNVTGFIKTEKNNEPNRKAHNKLAQNNLSDQTLRNRYSELFKLGEEFMITLWLEENRLEREDILMKKYLSKKLLVPYRILFKESQKLALNKKFDVKKLSRLIELGEMQSEYFLEINKEELLYDNYFENSKNVLCHDLIRIITIGFEFMQQELNGRKYASNYVTKYLNQLNIDEIIEEFSKSDVPIYKVTALNYYLYKAFLNENKDKYYFDSHKIFSKLFDQLDDDYKTIIFKIMINYCIRKFNEGNIKFQKELFKLYKEKLSQNLISDLKHKSYTFNHFRDYVYIGIAEKNYKWVERFIEKYSENLPSGIRDNEIRLSYGKLFFEKGIFEKSLENLNGLKPVHKLMYIDTSLLKLCNYYELKEFEKAFLEIDKLKHYFSNNKSIPKVHIISNWNFLKIYRGLLKINLSPERSDIGYLEKELNKIKIITKRWWLRKKIGELK
ncbi:MAG TPA: hypothetical protein PKA90_15040 [Ignavibacteria bacterium]|nr:hypothetical protein [Ignavibacteria bacterium]HMR41733.1 hypothetical protein [Ignavibacteria bacterium]